jgi:hypothetical protein
MLCRGWYIAEPGLVDNLTLDGIQSNATIDEPRDHDLLDEVSAIKPSEHLLEQMLRVCEHHRLTILRAKHALRHS